MRLKRGPNRTVPFGPQCELGAESVELYLVGGIGTDGYEFGGDEAGVEAAAARADLNACRYEQM